jgi:hypothetical protein
MKLPNAQAARVERKKLEGYLLSSTHPIGRSKAKFFIAANFSENDVVILERALLELARTGEVAEISTSPHGVKYAVDGMLSNPSGQRLKLRTIWIVEAGETSPRLVTAYPF